MRFLQGLYQLVSEPVIACLAPRLVDELMARKRWGAVEEALGLLNCPVSVFIGSLGAVSELFCFVSCFHHMQSIYLICQELIIYFKNKDENCLQILPTCLFSHFLVINHESDATYLLTLQGSDWLNDYFLVLVLEIPGILRV